MRACRCVALALWFATGGAAAARGQGSDELIAEAQRLAGSHPDSTEGLLQLALRRATVRAESATVWAWIGITQFLRGRDSVTRDAFRRALALQPDLDVRNVDQLSPRLATILSDERAATLVHPSSALDQPPHVEFGPPLEYPLDLWRRQVSGTVVVSAIVDTTGRPEQGGIEVLEVSDSAFRSPALRMVQAYRFTPGRLRGRAVRTMVRMRIPLTPPPIYATPLVGRARDALAAGHADSAITFTDLALDSAARATEGDRVYALIVRAWRAGAPATTAWRPPISRPGGAVPDAGAARCGPGPDPAPAGRFRQRPRPCASGLGTPTALGASDRIVLVSQPPVRYPRNADPAGGRNGDRGSDRGYGGPCEPGVGAGDTGRTPGSTPKRAGWSPAPSTAPSYAQGERCERPYGSR
jgi:hypothetical protein